MHQLTVLYWSWAKQRGTGWWGKKDTTCCYCSPTLWNGGWEKVHCQCCPMVLAFAVCPIAAPQFSCHNHSLSHFRSQTYGYSLAPYLKHASSFQALSHACHLSARGYYPQLSLIWNKKRKPDFHCCSSKEIFILKILFILYRLKGSMNVFTESAHFC